ncbi:MAG: peptidoglycan-binding domain-containing protein, partial [Myxococcota bacterium]
MTRIQGTGFGQDLRALQGLSLQDQTRLVSWAANSSVPNVQNLMQQLGITPDMFGLIGGVDSELATRARQHNSYTAHTGGPLQIGHKGESVRDLQRQLNALGANLDVDGYFGPKTEAALRSFQEARGLIPTGLASGSTLSNLRLDSTGLNSDQWSRYRPNYGAGQPQNAGADGANVNTDGVTQVNPTISTRGAPPAPGIQGLLDEIAEGEGTSDETARSRGYASGYDVTLGYGAYADDRSRPLTSMTLGEVKALQRRMLNNPSNGFNSSAVGRYQIVGNPTGPDNLELKTRDKIYVFNFEQARTDQLQELVERLK